MGSIFKIVDNKVVLEMGKQQIPLPIDTKGFRVLQQFSTSAWVKNDKNYFFIKGFSNPIVKKINTNNLVVINADFAKGDKQVYYQETPLPNSDPQTFRILAEEIPGIYYFSYDKNQLYALSDAAEGIQIWEEVDTESIIFWEKLPYFTDKNHLYYFNWHFIEYANHFAKENTKDSKNESFCNPIKGNAINKYVDKKDNQEVSQRESSVKDCLQFFFPKDDAWWNWTSEYYKSLQHLKNQIYHDGKRFFFNIEKDFFGYPFHNFYDDLDYYSIIPDTDFPTFQSLNQYYSKDKKRVYHITRPINADVDTFEVLGFNFAKDKNTIFYNGYACIKTDINSFELINEEFAKDKNTVFSVKYNARIGEFKGYANLLKPLKNSDPETFQIINKKWAKDKSNVYCYGEIWSKIDPSTFEFLFTESDDNNSWAKCSKGLYNANGRKIIKGVDGSSFQFLNRLWGKDKHAVFSFATQKILKNIDADSFEIIDDKGGARDKNYIYYYEYGEIKKRVRK